jgi:hypothetical protein
MHQVGAHVGSLVTVSVLTHAGTERTTRFHVVSQDSFPEIGGFVSLGTGALVTIAGLEHAFCTPGATLARCRLAMSRPRATGGFG